jgi:hypothetical protein
MDFLTPKIIFLFLALLAVLVYWGFNFVIIYHLTRFGIGTQPKKMAASFLMGAITIFVFCVTTFSYIDFDNLKSKSEILINKFLVK